MHDIRAIRENPAAFDAALARRGLAPLSEAILAADKGKRSDIGDVEALQAESNKLAKEIGALMGQGKRDEAAPLLLRSKELKAQLAAFKDGAEGAVADDPVVTILEAVPNVLADDVPEGADEADNVELRKWGVPREFDFVAKDHMDLADGLSSPFLSAIETEQTAKISGARFATLIGQVARLERALGEFMLDVHVSQFGYIEVSPPVLVRDDAMYGTGQLPKFTEDSYNTGSHWLVPTAEVPLTNLVRDSILDAEQLPLRMVARTPCFRSEAGSAGRDTRGLIRQHQFWKVEMVSITRPEESELEHERLTNCAESILQQLGLPHRVMRLCSGDTGFGAKRTHDLEVWLPGQGAYREISSCSTCGDFQARRMNARCRSKGERDTQFVHTLNCSGLAIGRTLIAVLENYQQKDGSIVLPDALHSYMNGDSVLR